MDNLQRASVSLLIDGDDLIPSEISALLGQEPRLGVKKDEIFVGSHGKDIQARTGKWQFGIGWTSPANVDEQIVNIFKLLNDDTIVWKSLTDRYHCYVAVGGTFNDWTGGLTIEAGTLRLLAERGLAIDFDLYAPEASGVVQDLKEQAPE